MSQFDKRNLSMMMKQISGCFSLNFKLGTELDSSQTIQPSAPAKILASTDTLQTGHRQLSADDSPLSAGLFHVDDALIP